MLRLLSILPNSHKLLLSIVSLLIIVLIAKEWPGQLLPKLQIKSQPSLHLVTLNKPLTTENKASLTSRKLTFSTEDLLSNQVEKLFTNNQHSEASLLENEKNFVIQRLLHAISNGIAPVENNTDYQDDKHAALELSEANLPYIPQWQKYVIQTGDTFSQIMTEFGLSNSETKQLLRLINKKEQNYITQLTTGYALDYQLGEQGELLTLLIMYNARDGILFNRPNEQAKFEFKAIKRAIETQQRLYVGTVQGNFSQSAQATGLNKSEIANLSQLLSKKIQFHRDTRNGDTFQVLIESKLIDNKVVNSEILAVHYEGKQHQISLINYQGKFFTANGHSLEKTFTRFPFTNHYRISSHFNLHRHHPVTGRIAPHHGTDFAMPINTKILAPANGKVILVTYNRFAGRFIVIDHGNGLKTRYLHLSKSLVKKGQQVLKGQNIALSGSSGRVTGPHLHYEILVNNRAVNSMRVKLPQGDSLQGLQLVKFKKHSKELIARLNKAQDIRSAVAIVNGKQTNKQDI